MTAREIDIILKRFDKFENKLDDLLEKVIPAINLQIALVKKDSSRTAKIITAIGGAITVAISVAMAWHK